MELHDGVSILIDSDILPQAQQETMKYFDSFVDEKGFKGKRFGRYVEKTKKYMLDQLKIINPEMFEPMDESDFPLITVYNLEDYVYNTIILKYEDIIFANMDEDVYYKLKGKNDETEEDEECSLDDDDYEDANESDENDDEECEKMIVELDSLQELLPKRESSFLLFCEYANQNDSFLSILLENNDAKGFFISLPKDYHEGGEIGIHGFVEEEMKLICHEFIRKRSASMKDIDESNYFLTLPDTPALALELLGEILSRVEVDMERTVCKRAAIIDNLEQSFEKFVDRKVLDLEIELRELKELIEEKDRELEDKNALLKRSYTNVATLEEYKKEGQQELLEYNKSLQRENAKVKDKYNQLLVKYEELKKNNIDTKTGKESISVEEMQLKELDVNGRYMFVIGRNTTFEGKLQEAFPNSTIISSNMPIGISTEMVVVLTQCIDHSLYYDVKNQCKQKKIKMIHTEYSNIELIKQMMQTEMQ